MVALTKAAIYILEQAGLPVGKFASNSDVAVAAFPERTLKEAKVTIWKPREDTLTLSMIKAAEPKFDLESAKVT